jgi:hypothetical protein
MTGGEGFPGLTTMNWSIRHCPAAVCVTTPAPTVCPAVVLVTVNVDVVGPLIVNDKKSNLQTIDLGRKLRFHI